MGDLAPYMRLFRPSRQSAFALFCGAGVGAVLALAILAYHPSSIFALVVSLFVLLAAALLAMSTGTASKSTVVAGTVAVVAVSIAPLLRSLLTASGTDAGTPDVVAMVGAIAALVTLVLVQRQIDIARRQLVLARSEINLVRQDLAYSREQSEFTREQLAELARRPRLTVRFEDGSAMKVLSRSRAVQVFGASMLVRNSGDRTSRDAYIEIAFPWSALQHDFDDDQIAQRVDTATIDDVSHRLFSKQIDVPIYRDLSRIVTVAAEPLAKDAPSFTLLWRMRDDFGAYPANEPWGRLEVRLPAYPATPLRYTKRWAQELFPHLNWDRSNRARFVYASLVPEAAEDVPIIDEDLQRRIEDVVWATPGLEGTTSNTGEIGVEFTLGEKRAETPGARIVTPEGFAQENNIESARHRCYVRADGAVEVRLPQDESNLIYQVLRAVAACYVIASIVHDVIANADAAHGKFAYLFGGLPGQQPIGLETERALEFRLDRDEFVERVTPLMMTLQRAGQITPVDSETRKMVADFWESYAARLRQSRQMA